MWMFVIIIQAQGDKSRTPSQTPWTESVLKKCDDKQREAGFQIEASYFKKKKKKEQGGHPLRFGLKPGMRVPSTG